MNDFEGRLRDEYSLHLSYPWYGRWKYDHRKTAETDNFLQSVMHDLDAAPMLLQELQRSRSQIYVCGKMGQTHHAQGLLSLTGDVNSTPGICDPMRAEIFLAREHREEKSRNFVETRKPGFVVAHEQAHVIDSALGDYVSEYNDGHFEGPPVAATHLDSYAADCLRADDAHSWRTHQNDLTKFFMPRAGLLADEDGLGRDNATEIVCDFIAHKLVQSDNQEYRDLKERYPGLYTLASVMLVAVQSKEGITAYRSMANAKTPFVDMVRAFAGTTQNQTSVPQP